MSAGVTPLGGMDGLKIMEVPIVNSTVISETASAQTSRVVSRSKPSPRANDLTEGATSPSYDESRVAARFSLAMCA